MCVCANAEISAIKKARNMKMIMKNADVVYNKYMGCYAHFC